MEKGWVNVFTANEEFLVDIAKELLQENNIESVVINHKDSALASFGDVELYVREEDEKQAATILDQLKKG